MLKSILRKKPLVSFYVLTFIITWGIWSPLIIHYFSSPYQVSFSTVPIPLILLAFLGFFGPSIAGIIMTGVEKGSAGARGLLSRWKILRIGAQWYLLAFLSQVFIDFASTQIAINVFSLDVAIDASKWHYFLPILLRSAFIGGAIAEETGWRGYALPKTMESRNALFSSIVIGLFWAVWHLPLCFIPGANFPVPLSPEVFLVFTVNVVFISIILAALNNNARGSLFICYLYHIMLNTSLFSGIFHFADPVQAWWIKIFCSAILHGILAIVIVIVLGPARLARRRDPAPASPRDLGEHRGVV